MWGNHIYDIKMLLKILKPLGEILFGNMSLHSFKLSLHQWLINYKVKRVTFKVKKKKKKLLPK